MPAPTVGTATFNTTTPQRGSKLERTLSVTTQATNLQLPYDPTPMPWQAAMVAALGSVPPREDAAQGVTVNTRYYPPGVTDPAQALLHPAFVYRPYDWTPIFTAPAADSTKTDNLYQSAADVWMTRFAPMIAGTWQCQDEVTDAGGTAVGPMQTFTVGANAARGFLRVSQTDSRYFQFDDGTPLNTFGTNIFGGHVEEWRTQFDAFAPASSIARIWIGSRSGIEICGGFSNSSSGRVFAFSALNGTLNSDLAKGAHTGRYCLRRSAGHGFGSTEVCLKPNVNYTLKFWANPEGGVAVTANVILQDSFSYANSTTTPLTFPANSGMQEYSVPWVGHDPQQGKNYRGQWNIAPTGPANATVLIDDIRVVDPQGNDVFELGDFERHVTYSQRQSWLLDQIVQECEAQGQYLRLNCLDNDDDFFNLVLGDGTPSTDRPGNHAYFYGASLDPLADLPVRRWHRYYARYLQARWGYSTAVAQFEYQNEGGYNDGNHRAAAQNFCAAVHSFAAHGRRPASTSVYNAGGTDALDRPMYNAPAALPDIDYADVHIYTGGGYEVPYSGLNGALAAAPGGRRGLGCFASTGNAQVFLPPKSVRGQGTWTFSIWMQADVGATMNNGGRGPSVLLQVGGGPTYNVPATQPPLTGQGLPWTKFTRTFDVADGLYKSLDVRLITDTLTGGTIRFQDLTLTSPNGRTWAYVGMDEPNMIGDTGSQGIYSAARYLSLSGDPSLGRPLTIGEDDIDVAAGYDPRLKSDLTGISIRHLVWGGANPFGGIHFVFNYAGDYGRKGGFFKKYLAAYQAFLAGVPLAGGTYRNIEAVVSTPQLIVTGQSDRAAGKAHFWAYNRTGNWVNQVFNPASVVATGGTVTLPGLPDGNYTVEQWDTTLGAVSATAVATSAAGVMTVNVPSMTSDAAFKVYPAGAPPPPPPPPPNPVPTPTPTPAPAPPPLPTDLGLKVGPPKTSGTAGLPYPAGGGARVYVDVREYSEVDGSSIDLASANLAVAMTDGTHPALTTPPTVGAPAQAVTLPQGLHVTGVPPSVPTGLAAYVWVQINGAWRLSGVLPLTQ